jgi:hypothetical protein
MSNTPNINPLTLGIIALRGATMTTTNPQPKWALIGVRVCAIYLVVWIVPVGLLLLSGSTTESLWLALPIVWSVSAALNLWRLSSRGCSSAEMTFSYQIFIPLAFLCVRDVASITWLTIISMGLIAAFWRVFLSRPAVKALFQNQQSTIQNPKS